LKVEILSRRRDRIRVRPESEEDLWTLRSVIRPGDYVRARTVRDVSFKGSTRKEKRPIVVTVRVKDVGFQAFTGRLRIFGVIVDGPEQYGIKGKHQAITVVPGMEIILEREGGWSDRVLERLRGSGPRGKAVLAAVDYDEYAVAVLAVHGYKIIAEESLHLPGKDDPNRDQILAQEITRIARLIVDTAKRYGAELVIIGGPGPLKLSVAEKVRELSRHLKIVTDDVSMGGRSGLMELLRRPIIERSLKEYAVVAAEAILEEAMRTAARSPELVAFGLDNALRAAEIGAIAKLLVIDSMLYSLDPEESEKTERLLEVAEKYRAEIHLVPEDSPVGEKLRPLGGVVAILRFPVTAAQ